MLPLLATVWFSASASACLGMAVDSHDRAPADAASAPHDHSDAHGHAAHAGQAHSEDGALHAQGTSHSHGACPHCPVSSGGSSSDSAAKHVVCALLDDVSDSGAQTSAQKTELEHFALLAQPIYVSPLELQSSAHLSSPIVAPVYRSVALNLRHCVFLI
jgi:hypothetical protein